MTINQVRKKNRKTERKKLQEKKRKENYNHSSGVLSYFLEKKTVFQTDQSNKNNPKNVQGSCDTSVSNSPPLMAVTSPLISHVVEGGGI